MKISIRLKLVAFITLTLLIVISVFSFVSLFGIKKYQTKQNEALLFNQKNLFEQYLSKYLDKKDTNSYINYENQDFYLRRADMLNEPWLQAMPAAIYNVKGTLLTTIGKQNTLNEAKHKELIKYAQKGRVAYEESSNIIYYYSPLKYKNKTVAIIELSYSIKNNNELFYSIEKLFLATGTITLLLGLIIASIYFTKFTKDINKITSSVFNIKKGDFKNVSILKRKDELGLLSLDIAYMSNTIEGNLKALELEKSNLSTACEKLKKMSTEQKEFIGNVTHEFKTPLTSIKAYADILGMYEYDKTLINNASISISKECDRLKAMIDSILNLSSLEKYDFELKKTKVFLKPLLDEICSRMLGKVKKNNLTLETSIDDITILADEENLRYIFINLIDNAIKYNKLNGLIKVDSFKDEDTAVIEISDTGIGIPQNDLIKIFEPFYRVKNDRSRDSGGTGLGLSLVKKLVEKQNGIISVESQVDVGSKFIIRFGMPAYFTKL